VIRAIVWKELREQGLIGLTLLVFGAGILVAAATLADPPSPGASPADVVHYLGAGRLATLLLAVTAGMVCGGAMFAAEREAGTVGFLESLPATRWQLWVAKLTAGLLLAVAQILVVLGLAAGLGQVGTTGFAVAAMVYALLAFAWGALGSTVARTTLGSVGVAIPAASVAALVYLFPIMLVFAQPGVSWPRPEGALIFLGLMLLTPLGASAAVFTRQDRERAADDAGGESWSSRRAGERVPGSPPRLGLRALAWLAVRQLVVPVLAGSAFAAVAGLTLLLPTVQPVLAWPILGLAAGVLAGVSAFADEQAHGTAGFWGERRLPVGRAWAVKVLAAGLFALWLVVVLVLPSIIRAGLDPTPPLGARGQWLLSGVFRSLLFDELGWQGWKFVFLPVVYGFAAGHLCGLVCRKAVVAAGVATLAGGTAAVLWLPSLLAGGLSHWQVWLPPAVALGVARLLLRHWAADRLTARGPLLTLAGGLAAVALVEAVGIGYRVVEVREDPAGEADLAFVAGLPEFDENRAGRDFRAAAERLSRLTAAVAPRFDRGATGQRGARVEDRLETVVQSGWPLPENERTPERMREAQELNQWVDALYAEDHPSGLDDSPWFVLVEKAAGWPTGIYEDPRRFTGSGTGVGLENARRMALVVLARGLQRQARDGDHAAFIGSFRVALALARALRNRSITPAAMTGQAVERLALYSAYQWARNLPAGSGAGRLAAAWLTTLLLAEHLEPHPDAPFDPTPHLLAERYVLRGLLAAPSQWLPATVTPPGKSTDGANAEADLIGFAWTVPWERERTRRLVGRVFGSDGRPGPDPQLLRGRPGTPLLLIRSAAAADLTDADRAVRTIRRGVALVLAVRLYQILDGRMPENLGELVAAGYLPFVPPDPFDAQPFRYRVSTGETLAQSARTAGIGRPFGPGEMVVAVAPGQAVIWSVGPDGLDQGGRQLPLLPGGATRQEDWVFLVPLPP
jgi:hypothetical protein